MTSSSSLYGTVTTQNSSSTNSTSLYGEAGTPIPDSSGNVVVRGDLIVLSGNILTTAATGNIFPANATTINLGLAATAVNIGAASGTTIINNSLGVNGTINGNEANFGNVRINPGDTTYQSTITTVADDLNLTSATGNIKLNPATGLLYSENNNRLLRPYIQSTTGNSSGLRISGPNTGTSATALVSVNTSSDALNTEFLSMQSRGSALTNALRFFTGKYTAGVLGAVNKSIAFVDNTNTYATINPAGTTIATDLATKTYVDAQVDANTTYTIDASTTTGGANFNLRGSDASVDTIKFAGTGGTLITRTDANTITINTAVPADPSQLTNGLYTLSLNADGTVSFPNYTFPTADGTFDFITGTGQVLETNGAGGLQWAYASDLVPTYTTAVSAATGGVDVKLEAVQNATVAIVGTTTIKGGTNVSVTNAGNVITVAATDTNTTYAIDASTTTGGANLNLTGSDSSTDSVAYKGAGATTVARTDANTITITSVDTNTTYTQDVSSTTGGANVNLVGSDSTTDSVAYKGAGSVVVTATDASTVTITGTDTNTTYTIASGAVTGGANLTLSGSDSSTDSVAYKGAGATTVTSTDVNTITITSTDTNTTYTQNASTTTGGANFNLVGSDATTDSIALKGAGATTVTRTDADTVTVTSTDTNTTYTQNASSVTGGAGLNLVGSDSTTDTVSFKGAGATTITRTDADTVTVTSTDTNTTYAIDASATTGGANLNLTGSDSSTDTVKIASGTGITVSQTDVNTISVASTITQYTDTQARAAVSNGVDLAVSGTDVYVKSLRDGTPVYGALNAMYNQVGYTFQPPALSSVSGNAGFDIVSSSGGAAGYTASCSITGYFADTQAGSNASPAIQMRSGNGTGTTPTASTLNNVIGTTNYGAYSTTDWASTIATQGQGGGINALHPLQAQAYSLGTVTDAAATLTPTAVARTQVTVASVAITGTNGFFSCTAATIGIGNSVVITGTNSGSGTITGYVSGNIYYVIGGNSSTTFQLSATPGGVPIATTAGTTTGLTFVRYIITVTYAAQTVAPYGTNAKVAVSGITGVTDGTYMSIGASTTTQVLLGTYTTAVSLGATPLLSIRNVTAAATGFRIRGFAANTIMATTNRINFLDHTAAIATYKSDIIAQQSVTPATFVIGTSSIAGFVLTVGTLTSGTVAVGSFITGTGVTANTYIISNIAGSGAGSTWLVSATQTVASTTITGSKQNLITSSVGLSYDRTLGNFYSTVTQTNPVANAENLMVFGTTDIASGVSIVSNGSGLTRITIARAGTYNIQFSAQIAKTGAGNDNCYIWLKKNGTTVTQTAGITRVSGNGDRIMASWNYLVTAAIGDYYELAWAATDTDVILQASSPGGVVPSVPSVILTVVPVGA
jgi:hypothetical protein